MTAVRADNRAVTANRIAALLAWAGVFVSGVLSYGHAAARSIPCGAGAGCDAVSQHEIGKWFGVPVAFIGLAAYIVLGTLATARMYCGPLMWERLAKVSLFGTVFGFVASLYFVHAQISVIRETCTWCMASAALMTLSLIATGWLASFPAPAERSPSMADKLVAFGGLVTALGAIGFYIGTMQTSIEEAVMRVDLGGVTPERIIPDSAKVMGDADAPLTIVEFADVNCPACRSSFPKLKALFQEGKGRIRLGFRHVPLVRLNGHEKSMHAAVVAELAADKGRFWRFMEAALSPENETRVKSETGLIAMAADFGITGQEVRDAWRADSPQTLRVLNDMDLAMQINAMATPTFVVFARGLPPVALSASRVTEVVRAEPYRSLWGD
jgi:protein-disulfide isomerase